MAGHPLGFLERAAVGEVVGDAGGAEAVAAPRPRRCHMPRPASFSHSPSNRASTAARAIHPAGTLITSTMAISIRPTPVVPPATRSAMAFLA